MHIVLKGVIAFVALCFLFLGAIFVIAGGVAENFVIGGVLLVIAFGLLGFLYYDSRIEARRPVHQEWHVTMGGSGELVDRQVECPSCGAPVEAKDITVVSGGLMIECPYCGTTSAVEEQPKW